MTIPAQLLDQVIIDYKIPEDLLGANAILMQLTKTLLERVMQAEMTDHLGYTPNEPSGSNAGISRNGSYKKKVKGDFCEMDIAVPRDRYATVVHVIIPKGGTIKEFDEKMLSLN